MVLNTILKTKLFIPLLQEYPVPRQRLISSINEEVWRKLVLVKAPAGFGKSTLAVQWTKQAKLPVAWLSLDRFDNDPVVFLAYFIASIQTLYKDFGESSHASLSARNIPPVNSLITGIINEIYERCEPFALILDDFHWIENESVIDALRYLINHQPPQLHLVITTRSDPPLPCSRFLAKGEMIELGIDDLRFNFEETLDFFRTQLGERISEGDISVLESHTEGWVTGLKMAAISLQSENDISAYVKNFSGADRHIMDFLLDEIFSRQAENVQQFLLKTSILDRLSASLCNAVVGIQNSQAMLDDLERSGLFVIPLDKTRTWYRYHHLFAEILQARLKNLEDGSVNKLHHLAFLWFVERNIYDQAIHHAIAADDFPKAINLIEQIADEIWAAGKQRTVLNWIENIPSTYIVDNARLGALKAYLIFQMGRRREGLNLLEEVEETIEQISENERKEITGIVSTIKGVFHLERGDFSEAVELATKAHNLLPKDYVLYRSISRTLPVLCDRFQNPSQNSILGLQQSREMIERANSLYFMFILTGYLAQLHLEFGNVNEAIKVCDAVLEKRTAVDYPISYSGAIDIILGESYFLIGELEKALDHIVKGVDFVKQDGAINLISSGLFTIARVQLARGQGKDAISTIQKLDKIVQQLDPSEYDVIRVKACEAYLWVSMGNVEKARVCLRGYDMRSGSARLVFDPHDVNRLYPPVYKTISKPLYHWIDFIDIVTARVFILEQKFEEALEIIETVLSHRENLEMKGFRLTPLILKASILYEIGKTEEATAVFVEALQLAEPEGRIQEFVEERQFIPLVLGESANYLALPDKEENAANLLEFMAKIGKQENFTQGQLQPDSVQMIEPLTQREMEVLTLLPKGLSYAQVAENLSVSENTVRTHIRGVYGKLGVNNRTQAISVARELGLLP